MPLAAYGADAGGIVGDDTSVDIGNTSQGAAGVDDCIGDTPTWTPDEDGTTHSWRCMECGTALDTQTHDFGDDRITIVTCTDDGTQRQIVVGELQTEQYQQP